jgi:hypothetical protein
MARARTIVWMAVLALVLGLLSNLFDDAGIRVASAASANHPAGPGTGNAKKATLTPTARATRTPLATSTAVATRTPVATSTPPATATRTSTPAATSTPVPPTATAVATATAVSSTPTPTSTVGGRSWYVSKLGSGADGLSWATAWNELNRINWSAVHPGDSVVVDGGPISCGSEYGFANHTPGNRPGESCGMLYATTLTVGKSGTASQPITVKLAQEAGRNGTAVLFGGRGSMLPYCGQSSYNGSPGLSAMLYVGSYQHVIFDGVHRSGFMLYGAQNGVRFASDSAAFITLRNMEIFDNGVATTLGDGRFNSDNPGVWLRGHDLTFERLLVHDNGQDDFQDATHGAGTLNNLTWRDSWIYFSRENPRYPGYGFSFNGPQIDPSGRDTGCQHVDGIQIWGGGTQSGLTVDHVVFGPLLNQGFYPSDDGITTYNNLTIANTLFLDVASHNLITDNPVYGWNLDRVTIFATQGGIELPTNTSGANAFTNSIKYGGYVYMPNWKGTQSGNITYGGDNLFGLAPTNPQFVGPVPTSQHPPFAQLRGADFTPRCGSCAGKGSAVVSVRSLLERIDGLNGNRP